jgi:hypothetical protein
VSRVYEEALLRLLALPCLGVAELRERVGEIGGDDAESSFVVVGSDTTEAGDYRFSLLGIVNGVLIQTTGQLLVLAVDGEGAPTRAYLDDARKYGHTVPEGVGTL